MRAVRSWDDFYTGSRTVPQLLRWATTHADLVARLLSHERVLEVGTGTGMLSALVGGHCARVVTLDRSARVLATSAPIRAALRSPVAPVQGDAFRLPFPAGSFDACFSQGLLEHFDDDEAAGLVAEQLRVASVAYVSVPSAYYPHVGSAGPGLRGDERLLTKRRWRSILGRWPVEARYYADFKLGTVAGRTVPWPAQLLLCVGGGPGPTGPPARA